MREGANNVATISADEFQVVRNILRQHAALVLDEGKEYLVEARLTPLASRQGFSSLSTFINRLRSLPSPDLYQKVVESMTIHETSFFRDWRTFQLLRQEIIPRIMKERAGERTINIWSAACSTGQEPYSIAVLLNEHFPDLSKWKIRLFATDISNEAITRAQQGKFNQLEVNRGLPAALLVKYFQRKGVDFIVNESIRKMVAFQQLNLATNWTKLPVFDIVLMRNVLIYFGSETKRDIFSRLARAMIPKGYLVLGTGETTYNLSTQFERTTFDGAGCFQLVGGSSVCK